MKHKGSGSERLNTKDGLDVSVSRSDAVIERLRVFGIYHAVCRRPRPEFLAVATKLISHADICAKSGRFRESEYFIERKLALPHDDVWEERFPNLVVDIGKNHMLDNYLAGSSFTQVGPYIGLISDISYSGIVFGDIMTSHAGWLEAGNAHQPTYTAPRKTAAFGAASAGNKALSAPLTYAITGPGTLKGAFMVLGSGAVSTIDNTAGTLFSAGLFVGGDKPVANLDSLSLSWSLSV